MTTPPALGQRFVFVVLALIFLALLVSAGVRSTPGVLLLPLQDTFGWSRETVSLAAAIGIFLYGLVGPFAAALMQTLGIRRTLLGGLTLISLATALSTLMREPWHLVATWGVLSGLGTGCLAMVLGAAIVNRWFVARRGLMMGLLAASTATGNLVFLPLLAHLASHEGWQTVVLTVAVASAALIPLVAWLLPERPADIGLRPHGAPADYQAPAATAPGNLFRVTLGTLAMASRRRDFWLLFLTFFVCGFTTNGLIGTHFIAMGHDHGLSQVQAAGILALMGIFDLVGTTASGWLTDRYDPRRLLFVYYSLRGLSLIYLPFSGFAPEQLLLFGIFYGLDWIATVPPTVKLTNQSFGEKTAPVVFGWVFCGHMLGAACAAFLAGALREHFGSYQEALVLAGLTGILAALMALWIGRPSAAGAGRSAVPEVG